MLLKKTATILLLMIMLFNWFGYRLMSTYFENKTDQLLEAQFDDQAYNDADLVHFKIAAAIPYNYGSSKFERVDGEVVINGVSYKYVKRRFYKDSLEVYCLPNIQKKEISNARDAFFKLANDVVNHTQQGKKTSGHSSHVKYIVDDYTSHFTKNIEVLQTFQAIQQFALLTNADLRDCMILQLERPPQAKA